MLKIGLTGNYYSGYNEVGDIFEELGMPVFDADLIIKYMLNYSVEYVNKIKFAFGENIYYAGLLDLSKFDTNEKFDKLFDIIQLDLIKSYEKWRIKNWNKFYTIFKCSVLFERKLDANMNYTITTFTPELQRKHDLITTSQMPREMIDNILSNEMDELLKNQKATYVIHGYRGLSELRKSVNDVHRAIMKKNTQGILSNEENLYKNIFS